MSDFVSYLHEVFEDFGPIRARRMFGGYGIYHDGLMFGLVADDTLYLKVDDQIRPMFEQLGLGPFEYTRNGKVMNLSYYEAPPELLEVRQEATRWAALSYEAALRAKAGSRRRPRRK